MIQTPSSKRVGPSRSGVSVGLNDPKNVKKRSLYNIRTPVPTN